MQYDFNLPPGGALNLDVKGKFFKYRSGTGPIRVRASKGGYVDLLPGQGVWSLDYDSLNVQDRSGAQNMGVLIAGDFDFHDDRITGTVEVIDGGRTRTNSENSFSAVWGPSGTAASYNQVQLFNPVGSGKRVIIDQVMVGSSAFDVIQGYFYATALDAYGYGQNKKSGGAQSVCEARIKVVPVRLMATPAIMSVSVNGSSSIPYRPTSPFLLLPGTGFMLQNAVQNVGLYADIEFYEESIT